MTETMMREAAISFPMFGDFQLTFSASFNLFGREVYWYGVSLAVAFLVTLLYVSKRSKNFGIKSDDIYEHAIWLIPLGVIGCRIYFVIFKWSYYSQHLNEIYRIWDGGIAMYGGIIMGLIVIIAWTKIKKIPLGALLDADASGLLLAHSIGRWGNFTNREAFGTQTDIFCKMGLTNPGAETIYVHPTFLYESLWTFTGWILINRWERKGHRKYDGQMFILYIMWYGMGRSWIEGLRTDSLYLIPDVLRVSQVVAIVSALAMATTLIIQSKRPHPPEKLYVNQVNQAASGTPEECSTSDIPEDAPDNIIEETETTVIETEIKEDN